MWDLPDTSHSLIARVKDLADGAAWTEFLAIYRPVVYRMARRRGLQDADSQDLTQRVFLAISQAIDGWKPGPDRPPFRAWLVSVTRNAITKALSRTPPDRGAGSSSVMELLAGEYVDDPETTAELLIESRREALRWPCACSVASASVRASRFSHLALRSRHRNELPQSRPLRTVPSKE